MRRSRLPALGQPARAGRRTSPSSALVVLNLVGGFHALGTLLAVGMMMLPAIAARFWTRDIDGASSRSRR